MNEPTTGRAEYEYVIVGLGARGFRFDATLKGEGNGGHVYGADLFVAEKSAPIGYLKPM